MPIRRKTKSSRSRTKFSRSQTKFSRSQTKFSRSRTLRHGRGGAKSRKPCGKKKRVLKSVRRQEVMKGGSPETNPTQVQVKIFPNENYVDGILDKNDNPEDRVHTIKTIEEGKTYEHCLKDPTEEGKYYQPQMVRVMRPPSKKETYGILHPNDKPTYSYHTIIIDKNTEVSGYKKINDTKYVLPPPVYRWPPPAYRY